MRHHTPVHKCVSKLILATSLMLAGCSDGSSFRFTTYSGVWDVVYNVTGDSCGVIDEDTSGFNDVHTINQLERDVALSAESELILNGEGTVNSDDAFVAEEIVRGDIFNAGLFCEYIATTSYTDPDEDSADSLFLLTIECNDGFSCETRAIGEATRRRN